MSHGPALVRVALPGDAAGVAELIEALGYPCNTAEAGDRLKAVATDLDQTVLVADGDGALCGLLGLDVMYYLPLGARTCRITALVVADTHRGSGIGRDLLQAAEAWARQAGAARIEVTSAAHRNEAHAFYRACGYRDGSVRFVKQLGDA
ncbi:MAG: GNAT family N-acetyltransferase [Lysobacteraceae bacterium]